MVKKCVAFGASRDAGEGWLKGRMTPVTPGKIDLDHGDDLLVSGLEVMSVKSNRN